MSWVHYCKDIVVEIYDSRCQPCACWIDLRFHEIYHILLQLRDTEMTHESKWMMKNRFYSLVKLGVDDDLAISVVEWIGFIWTFMSILL